MVLNLYYYFWALNVWQVTNYHVVEKLATDQNGRQRCKVLIPSFYNNTRITTETSIIIYSKIFTSFHFSFNFNKLCWLLLKQIFLIDKNGKSVSRDGKIVGVDPSSDLAVLKVGRT